MCSLLFIQGMTGPPGLMGQTGERGERGEQGKNSKITEMRACFQNQSDLNICID